MEKDTDVYEYSKKSSSLERYEAAQNVKLQREAYFSRQIENEDKLTEVLSKKESIERIFSEIADLEEYERGLESSFFGKVLNFVKLRSVRKEIGDLQGQASEDDLQQAIADAAILEEAQKDRHEIEEAKQVLAEFWQDQTKEFAEADEASKVESVSRDYDALVIHTFSEFTPNSNSLLNQGLSWKEKLEVFLAFSPTVSCSGINDGRRGMWSNVGVILNGGRVLQAGGGDGATVARGLKERTDYNPIYRGKIRDQIAGAMKALPGYPNAYNELVVEDGRIAGMFYTDPKHIRTSGASIAEVIKFADELGIPFYHLMEGKLYKRDENGGWDYTPVDRQVVLDESPDLSELTDQLKKKYLSNLPFKKEKVV